MTNKIIIYCPTCFFEWATKSKRKKVTCANCGNKVENKHYVPLEAKPEVLYNGKTSKQLLKEPQRLTDVQ